jgi:predicted permease
MNAMADAILNIVAPVFLILAAGFATAKSNHFSDAAIDGVLVYVIRFATPALLFVALYTLDLSAAFSTRQLIAFYVGAFASFFVGYLIGRVANRSPGECIAIGFCALFGNTLMLGLPIVGRAYGDQGLLTMYGVVALHAPVMYMFGVVAMEVVKRDGAGALHGAKNVVRTMATNTLTIGIMLGAFANATQLRLPEPAFEALSMIAETAIPTALFALGAALTRYKIRDDIVVATAIAVIALIFQPLATFVLANYVIVLDPLEMRVAVLTAAMPPGLNVYIFATMYRRAEGVAAAVVILSTVLSIATLSFWLAFLGGIDQF